MITFAFVVTSATTIVVFSMQTTVTKEVQFVFDAQPPATAYIGAPWSDFSVKLVENPGAKPIAGATVTLDLYPVQPVALTGVLPSGQAVGMGSVDCLASTYGTRPLTRNSDALL